MHIEEIEINDEEFKLSKASNKRVTAKMEEEFNAVIGENKKQETSSKITELSSPTKEGCKENSTGARPKTPKNKAIKKTAQDLSSTTTATLCEISPNTSPRIPSIPASSFQFQADWKVLRNHPEKLHQYFKVS